MIGKIRQAKWVSKTSSQIVVTDLCNLIEVEKRKINLGLNNRIPNQLIHNLVRGIRTVFPLINRHTITNEYWRQRINETFHYPNPPSPINIDGVSIATGNRNIPAPVNTPSPTREKGGCPVGTTQIREICVS